MSSPNPNKTKVLVGFGVVAVVVVATIAFWPPTFLNEDASGAIGAVQKHNEPQITQKDVILGDEQTRTQQSVLYGDFFDNAQKLQVISVSLAARGSRSSVEAQNVQDLANELQARYNSRMNSALGELQLRAKNAGNVELAADAEALASKLKSAQELSSAEMQEFANRFANLVEMNAMTASKASLMVADKDLALAVAEMANTELAASKLQNVGEALASEDVALANVSLENHVEYFANMAAASKVLADVEQMASQNMANRLNAAELLANRANALAQAALANIGEQTASHVEMSSAIASMESQLAAARGNKAFNEQLANLAQKLASRREEFAARAGSMVQAELAAIGEYAASRQQYSNLANEAPLASAVAGSQLASKQFYSKLANTEAVANRLASMHEALQDKQFASILANEGQLVAHAAELQNKLAARD